MVFTEEPFLVRNLHDKQQVNLLSVKGLGRLGTCDTRENQHGT